MTIPLDHYCVRCGHVQVSPGECPVCKWHPRLRRGDSLSNKQMAQIRRMQVHNGQPATKTNR